MNEEVYIIQASRLSRLQEPMEACISERLSCKKEFEENNVRDPYCFGVLQK